MTLDELDRKTFILAAGGTGGHVFPAIATAQELKNRGHLVYFSTDIRGEKYLKNAGFEYMVMQSASPTGKLPNRVKAMFKLMFGMLQSGYYIGKTRPDMVIGFGGYPSFPPLLSAKINFLKTILHEQNSVLGKANRFLARYSTIVATSFPQTKNAPNGKLTGNPVRAEIVETPLPSFDGKLNILITGGSQGAKLFAEVLPGILRDYPGLKITQQARDNEIEAVTAIYEGAGVEFEVKSFFDDMPKRLAQAHLVICRSGASTIFELAKVGRPALFVPLATAAENHQYLNAKAVADIGGGWIIPEKDFNAASISAILSDLINNPAKLAEAAEKIKRFTVENAAKNLADAAEELLK